MSVKFCRKTVAHMRPLILDARGPRPDARHRRQDLRDIVMLTGWKNSLGFRCCTVLLKRRLLETTCCLELVVFLLIWEFPKLRTPKFSKSLSAPVVQF